MASGSTISIESAIRLWVGDGRAMGWSAATIRDRTEGMGRFTWWMENRARVPMELASVSPNLVRGWLTYLREPCPEGRYGNPSERTKRPCRPSTIHDNYRMLRAFSNFCLAEGLIAGEPMKNVKPPIVPREDIQPPTVEQIQAMLDHVRRGRNPDRDVTMILTFFDTGIRCSELLQLKIGDFSGINGRIVVQGKGNKKRTVQAARTCRRAIGRYLENCRRDVADDEPLFVAGPGPFAGKQLTRFGVFIIISGAAKAVGISVSPHDLRHGFALGLIRNGANLMDLQRLMGHTDITLLTRYTALSQDDLERAHRSASPADQAGLK